MDISKWAFRNRNLIYFLIAVLLFGGAYSCYQMSKLEDPEIKVKLAMVVTTYPGASAHQVELEVTDVLEKNIRTMGNIDNIESYSYNDLCSAVLPVPDTDRTAEHRAGRRSGTMLGHAAPQSKRRPRPVARRSHHPDSQG